jgi:hypothetical protein
VDLEILDCLKECAAMRGFWVEVGFICVERFLLY